MTDKIDTAFADFERDVIEAGLPQPGDTPQKILERAFCRDTRLIMAKFIRDCAERNIDSSKAIATVLFLSFREAVDFSEIAIGNDLHLRLKKAILFALNGGFAPERRGASPPERSN